MGGARVGEGHGDRDEGVGGAGQHQQGADHPGQISGGPKDVPSNSTSNQILHRVLKCGVSRLDICPTWKQGNEADQN